MDWLQAGTHNRQPPTANRQPTPPLYADPRRRYLLLMSISEQVDSDIKDAMRARQADKLSVLRLLKAAIKNAAIEKGGQSGVLDDAEATAVIRKQVKQRQDSVESFEKGGRPELAERSGWRSPPSRTTSPAGAFLRTDRCLHHRGHRRDRCFHQGPDGRGDEGCPGQGRGPRRRQNPQSAGPEASRLRAC